MSMNDHENSSQRHNKEKNPFPHLSDSINRSMVGDLGSLTQGGCMEKIFLIIIVVIVFFILSKCSTKLTYKIKKVLPPTLKLVEVPFI